jgi:hypothetical protein
VEEVPITFGERTYGSSKMSWRIALEAAWLVPQLRRGAETPPNHRKPPIGAESARLTNRC